MTYGIRMFPMKQEREAKFLGADPEAIREKLRVLGATRVHPERLMRRTVFDFSDRQPARREPGFASATREIA